MAGATSCGNADEPLARPQSLNPKQLKLEQQVASLALCRRLKAPGVCQESACFWNERGQVSFAFEDSPYAGTDIAAFTVAELGEMLPPKVRTYRTADGWECVFGYSTKTGSLKCVQQGGTEADAKATARLVREFDAVVTHLASRPITASRIRRVRACSPQVASRTLERRPPG